MNRFADYFVICGLDLDSGLEPDKFTEDNLHVSPLERSYKCKVLSHYPDNVIHNPFDASAVGMFCLPQGLKFRTQKHSVTQAPIFHSFVITREDGKRCYGFSLVFYEEVKNRDICNAMQTLQAMYITELSGGLKANEIQKVQQSSQSRSLPRHFKLTTNGALTYYDISKDKLFVSKSISMICQIPFVSTSKTFLENLFRCLPKRNHMGTSLSLESYVFNLLYEVHLPTVGKSLLIYLPPTEPHLNLVTSVVQIPAAPFELPHLDYPIRLLFTWLGIDLVVQLFTCLLLENQILLRSSDCQRLMVVAETIISLLFPFIWPHVYVPILPASLHHFLDAPVPFLMGLYASTENIKVASEASLCFVDIDKCKIQSPEEIVTLPHLDSFTSEILAALDKHGVHVPNSDSGRNPEVSRACTLPGRPQNRRKLSIHDTFDNDRPPSPPGSARSEALQRIADIVRRTGVALENDAPQPRDSYIEDQRLNNSIREIFLNRFVHVFHSYENFVIFPPNSQTKDDWFNNRDSMQNFDKASFLSDQPQQDRLFLSRFLESQMFATLIDNKILTSWGDSDQNLTIFDYRIRLLKQRYGGENLIRSLSYEPCTCSHETQKLLERRLSYPDFEAPPPREVSTHHRAHHRNFPILDRDILNKSPVTSKGSIPRASALRKPPPFARNISTEKAKQPDLSPAVIAHTNWSFVEKLLKDCKAKTKRMLLAKLGAEGVTISGGPGDLFGVVEENTLVASLCEFLERVWSHGMHHKRGKSALWSHLSIYQENYNGMRSERSGQDDGLGRFGSGLLFDINNIQAMSDVKTGIGMAKAWIRLALEKKQLSKYLRTLLSDQTILRSLYKRSAFLRSDEEKEQFLYHLLTLNAVDYFCFTSTYATTLICYRILIVPNKKGATTSANAWVVLSGTLSETTRVAVPKITSQAFELKTRNLGVLTTLRIGHDNSGLYAKWMIDFVLVRNEITCHTYKFPCGRWLGRGVDDGSTERLLVGCLIPTENDGEENTPNGSINRRSRSPGLPRTELKPSTIQHMLGDCVNSIVKWHYRRNSERNTTLAALLCGENGLVDCLGNVFTMGFKSAWLFVGKNYVWDYFVRVKEQFENDLLEESTGSRSASLERNHQSTLAVWRCYCHLIDEILYTSKALGKDGKFQLFVCLSVREHLLHRMLTPMAACKVTLEMYEENSFLRNRGLLTFLRQILLPLDDLEVVLENSVTHGISSPASH